MNKIRVVSLSDDDKAHLMGADSHINGGVERPWYRCM